MTTNELRNASFNGITLTEISGFSLVHVATRGGRTTAGRAIKSAFGVAAPQDPNTVAAKDETFVFWFGPTSWLVRRNHGGNKALPGVKRCAVTDFSDSRCQFRISGPRARELLSTGCPVDVEKSMPTGSCAQTTYNHFQVFVHRLGDEIFDLYVLRSFAEDFWKAITYAAGIVGDQ